MSILEVSDLGVQFPTRQGTVQAVRDVNFSIKKGELLGVVGESGSGKSVIGSTILQILPHSAHVSGSVRYQGTEIRNLEGEALRELRGRSIALVPQNPGSSLNPLLTNGRQIDEVYINHGSSLSVAREKTLSVLKRFLFPDPVRVAGQYPHQLSGGMQQRVVTAIGTAEKPSLIVADEPTKGLDKMTRETSRDLFRKITTENKTSMLLITHDLDLAEELCDRIAVMYASEFVEAGEASDVLSDPSHPYTQGLIQARPGNGLIPLEGSSPDLTDLPKGCYFQYRCRFCTDRCRIDHPPMISNSGREVRCHLHS